MTIVELYGLCENMSKYTEFIICDCGVKIAVCDYENYLNTYALRQIVGFKHLEPNRWEIHYI